ncbi:MAG: ABC transporter, partial [Deltaproteobacteria bacterium]|nr:ABC transporter [Deltaproteobacteria bacterium]
MSRPLALARHLPYPVISVVSRNTVGSTERNDAMAQLTLERLSKDFGTIRAVDGITVTVEDGEFLALLGPSGCG